MKKTVLALLLALFIIVVLGCQQENDMVNKISHAEENSTESNELVKNSGAIQNLPERQYKAKGVFIKKRDGTFVAVLENGEVVKAQNTTKSNIYTGCTSDSLVVKIGEKNEHMAIISYPFTIGYQIPVQSSPDNAPKVYAKFMLDNLIYNGTSAAISEYKLNNVKVLKKLNQGRIDVAMNFDVKPCRNSTVFGNSSDNGFVENLTYNFVIYGTEDIWVTMGDSNFIEEIQKNQQKEIANLELSSNQEFIYTSKEFSYYTEKCFLPQKEEDKKMGGLAEYDTSIWSVNNITGERKKITEAKRNTDFSFSDYVNDKLYVKSQCWIPYSESFIGDYYFINENSQEFIKIFDSSYILSTVEEVSYVLLGNTIYKIDLSKASVTVLCDLPEPIQGEDHPMQVCNVINGIMKVVYYNDLPVCYEINFNKGSFRKLSAQF